MVVQIREQLNRAAFTAKHVLQDDWDQGSPLLLKENRQGHFHRKAESDPGFSIPEDPFWPKNHLKSILEPAAPSSLDVSP